MKKIWRTVLIPFRKVLKVAMMVAVKISAEIDARDVVIGVGLLMVSIGCWLIYRPSAFIVVGVGLFGLGTGMIKITTNAKMK